MKTKADTTYSRPPLRDDFSRRWRRWLDRWPLAAWVALAVIAVAFYVKSTQDPNTKAISNTLVKRGREWHAPDRMILNANMIVLVEPVNPSSRVAQLIAQAKNQ